MKMNTHLAFHGQCREAFQYYEKALGGQITFMMTWSESPMADQLPAGHEDDVMHATIKVGDNVLMGADAPPGNTTKPRGFAVAIHTEDVAEAERIFSALSEGAEIQMPLEQTFWAKKFGMLIDRYGIPWMINCGEQM